MSPKPALNRLFLDARTHGHWLNQPVEDDVLRQLYELARVPPTPAGIQPLRMVFLKSAEAKERLRSALAADAAAAVMEAPITAIVACEMESREQGTKPTASSRSRPGGRPVARLEPGALLNGAVEGGYVILAARALGLDCGPIATFDNAAVDEAFMAGTNWRSMFLLNLGFADHARTGSKRVSPEFEDACRIV